MAALSVLVLGIVWFGYHASPHEAVPARAAASARPATARIHPRPQVGLGNLREASSARIPERRSVSGRVSSADGAPLSRANVCSVERAEACCALAQCSLTEASGLFELENLGADVVSIVASASGHLPRRQGLATVDDADPFVEITLAPGGVAVEGTVVDATGGPLPFARVMARAPDASFDVVVTTSDGDGHFELHVPPGVVHVIAEADAYARAIRSVQAPARAVTLALAPSAGIAGRVIQADDGRPLDGVDVTARSLFREPELLVTAQTDADGTFYLQGLGGAELYEVFAHANAWRSPAEQVSIDVAQTPEPIVLRALPATTLAAFVEVDGEACSGATVSLLGPTNASAFDAGGGHVSFSGLSSGEYRVNAYCPGALPYHDTFDVGARPISLTWQLTRGLVLRGRVLGPSGLAVAGSVVSVAPVGEPSERSASRCRTAQDGTFACSGLSPGSYDCNVDDAGDPAREVVRVNLTDGATPDVVLHARPTGTLRVVLRASRPGNLPVLRVFVRGPSGMPIEAARDGGTFELTGMPLGEYDVYVELPTANGQPARAALTHDGQIIALELAAPPLLSIQGRAVDRRGTPWVDAWVSVVPSDPLARPNTSHGPPVLTDDRGDFRIEGLAPGAYDVHVSNRSGQGELRRIAAGAGDLEVLIESEREPTEATLGG